MKITCQSCQAKYTIADEKVAGKTVKIKCKKCGATIVVSGSDAAVAAPTAAASSPGAYGAQAPGGDDDEGDGATRVFAEGQGPAGGGEEWTVNVTDEDQRTLTSPQIVVEYQRGVVTNDTYVWKDGMADWLPLCDVPELMRMVSVTASRPAAGGTAAMPAAHAPAPAAYTPAPAYAPQAYAQAPAPQADVPAGGLGGTMIMNESAPSPQAAAAPAAARRGGKAGGGVDLFAPGQRPEVAHAAPTATTSADRLVGERNENSVLFSISALTAAAGAGKQGDDPFDLRGSSRNNGRSNVDDIMNLGGGMSGPMLAPPPLMAPIVEAPPPPPPQHVAPAMAAPAPAMNMGMNMPAMMVPEYTPPKSKMPLIIGIVASVALLGGGAAFFASRGGSSTGPTGTDSAKTAVAADTGAATPPPQTAATPTPTPTPTPDAPKPADTGAQAGGTPTPTPTPPSNPGKPAVGGPLHATEKPEKAKPEPEAKPEPKPEPPPPAATAKAADPGGGGKEFDRAAAMGALSAASGAARGCKKDDGPTGTARVKVTFAPSGSVTSASVDGAPFAGTSVGGCIAGAFRGAHVPAFDGSPVTVSKSISIN